MDRARRSRHRLVTVVLGLLLLAGVSGCSYSSPRTVGVTRTGDGDIAIVLAPCVRVTNLRVYLTEPDVGYRDDWIDIWTLESADREPTPTTVRLGGVPPGFREVTPYNPAWLGDTDARLIVDAAEGELSRRFGFDPREVRPGLVLARGEAGEEDVLMELAAFRERAAADCERGHSE